MNIDEQSDSLATPLTALRSAMAVQMTPPGVEKELLAAFAAQCPRRRWHHALSASLRHWGPGVGATAVAAVMALTLTMHTPASLDADAGIAIHGVDEGSPFIALESMERIEQEVNPRVLEADLPRTALASLGLPVNPETAGDSVRAEMLVGADGSPLAMRLVSHP